MNVKQLQGVLIVFSAIGILSVGVLVAVMSIFPLYSQLRTHKERNLQLDLQTRTLKIEEFLNRAEEIAQQIISRTKARQVLVEYNQGKIPRDQAVEALSRILKDALNQSEDVVGISRLDATEQLILQVGLPIPQTEWVIPTLKTQTPQIRDPIQLQGEFHFVIAAPIFNENQRIGTDLVLFKFTRLEKIVKGDTRLGTTRKIAIGTVQQNQVQLFFPLSNLDEPAADQLLQALYKATKGESGLLNPERIWFKQNVIAFEPISRTNWGLAIGIKSQTLYAPVHRLLLRVGGVIIILILLGTGIMVFLLRPLTGRVMIRTDELEQQLQYQNLALRELNYTQEQLLLEIRDRKQAEKALREALKETKRSQQLLQTLIDATPDWIFLKNRDFQFILVNQSLAKALAMSPEELVGKDDLQLGFPPEQIFGDPHQGIRGFRADDQRALNGEFLHNPYDPATTADGSVRILDTQKLPLKDENNEVFAILGFSRDITERHTAEAALQKSEALLREKNQILEQTLQELKCTQTQMIQSEKMSSLGQMVAGVAHEINNPVSFIHGNLHHTSEYTHDLLRIIQLYQHYYPNPPDEIETEIEEIDLEFIKTDLTQILKSMKAGTERIREIVKSLRNFSRLDEAELKEVNLHEGIESTLMILNNRLTWGAGLHEIKVIRDYGKLPLVDCYPSPLNQVFMNIINNAIDALDEKNKQRSPTEIVANPSTIQIQTKVCRENWVAIHIADNGPGMSETIRDRLFDPFFTTKPIGKGTGLGLSISYQIVVEKHQGYLQCHSAPDQGTEFVIEIPICPELLE